MQRVHGHTARVLIIENQFDLDAIAALFIPCHIRPLKLLDFFLTSSEILLKYSIICTSQVNILPSGLFFLPSVVPGEDEGKTSVYLASEQIRAADELSCQLLSVFSLLASRTGNHENPHGSSSREVRLMRHPRGLTLRGGSCLTPPPACFKRRQEPITSVMLSCRRRLTCVKISFDLLASFSPRLTHVDPPNTPVTSSVICEEETCLKMTNKFSCRVRTGF